MSRRGRKNGGTWPYNPPLGGGGDCPLLSLLLLASSIGTKGQKIGERGPLGPAGPGPGGDRCLSESGHRIEPPVDRTG